MTGLWVVLAPSVDATFRVGRRSWRSRQRIVAAITFVVALMANWLASPHQAGAYNGPSASVGLDISWPQCKSGIPTPAVGRTITIIGVTGGKAFTQNPCFATEYRWTVDQGHVPAFYMNLDAPSKPTAGRGRTGPQGSCGTGDESCIAFNYGYNAAQDAVNYAGSFNATSPTWWLDVETGNHWSTNRFLNAQVIRGATRYYQDHNVVVGIYSVSKMWGEIAGDLTLGMPIWVAQTSMSVPSLAYCSPAYAFGGGITTMVQSWNGQYDVDYNCPPASLAIRSPAAVGETSDYSAAMRSAPPGRNPAAVLDQVAQPAGARRRGEK